MTISRLSKLLRLALSHLAISLFALTVARSQSSITITSPSMDAATAAASRTTYVAPVYPPIAKAAQVVGTVVLQIEIVADGSVGKVKVLSGPPMLNGAAVEAVKQWRTNLSPWTAHTLPSAQPCRSLSRWANRQ